MKFSHDALLVAVQLHAAAVVMVAVWLPPVAVGVTVVGETVKLQVGPVLDHGDRLPRDRQSARA